jgi:hypothetical protein
MSFEIPLLPVGSKIQTLPDFTAQADLDDVTYTLRWRWNNRAAFWWVSILDETGTILYAHVKAVVNFPYATYRATPIPPGALVLVDTSGKGHEAGFEDLGARCALLYFTASELGLVASAPTADAGVSLLAPPPAPGGGGGGV